MNDAIKNINNSQSFNNINDVLSETTFSKEEIQFIYRDFKQVPLNFLHFLKET